MVEELKVNAKDRPFLGYLIGYTSHSPHSQEMYDYFKKVYGLQLNTYQGVLPEQIQKSLEADPQTARAVLEELLSK